MKKVIKLVVVMFLAFALVGCHGGKPKETVLTGITVKTEHNRSQIQVGTNLQCTVAPTPSNATVGEVTWSVDKPELATISATGLLHANDGEATGIVKVTAKTTNSQGKTLEKSKSIKVQLEEVVEYPDLGGYTISIANAETALGEWDPFRPQETRDQYGFYEGADRLQKQEAWEEVETDFNCHFEVVAYPADASWGPSRWNYIEKQARLDAAEFDLYVVPDFCLSRFVAASAVLDVSEYYRNYGYNMMNSSNITGGSFQGKLYTINTRELEMYSILAYNIGLWEKLNEVNPQLKEPAQAWLDGEWSYTEFYDYCMAAQTALDSLYPPVESEGVVTKQGYILSGWPPYYWVGMVDAGGTPISDVDKLKMNITGPNQENAANTLRNIYAGGAFDTAFGVDGAPAKWKAGMDLFNTGDYWFINSNQDRYKSDQWGEDTRYGYVPFPAPDGYNPEETYVGLTTESCLVMAGGRSNAYRNYGDDCNAENIYRAYLEYLYRAKTKYEALPGYDKYASIENICRSRLSSTASQQAWMKMVHGLETYGFYEPVSGSSNAVVNMYATDFETEIRKFVNGTGAATWAEAVGGFQSQLDDAITAAYGGAI